MGFDECDGKYNHNDRIGNKISGNFKNLLETQK